MIIIGIKALYKELRKGRGILLKILGIKLNYLTSNAHFISWQCFVSYFLSSISRTRLKDRHVKMPHGVLGGDTI